MAEQLQPNDTPSFCLIAYVIFHFWIIKVDLEVVVGSVTLLVYKLLNFCHAASSWCPSPFTLEVTDGTLESSNKMISSSTVCISPLSSNSLFMIEFEMLHFKFLMMKTTSQCHNVVQNSQHSEMPLREIWQVIFLC